MKKPRSFLLETFLVILCSLIPTLIILAETIHVDVIRGEIILNKNSGIDAGVPRDSLRPEKERPENDLGAGLFIESSGYQPSFKKNSHIYKTVSGVDIQADVYRPVNNEIVPVLLYLHGGGLILGNREHLSDLLRDRLIDKNYAVVSIDFRLAPETKLEQIIDDVKDACQWVRKKGPELFRIDPGKLVIMGSSSGGYLALVVGYWQNKKPNAIISLSGLADLDLLIERENSDKSNFKRDEGPYSIVTDRPVTDGDAKGRMELAQYLGEHGWMLSETLGFDVKDEPARYEKFVLAKNIAADFPPTLVIHAKQDKFVPFAEAEKIQKALNNHNIKNEMIVVEEGHSSQIFMKYPEVLDQLGSFLNKVLK